jgi:hypothetical protein
MSHYPHHITYFHSWFYHFPLSALKDEEQSIHTLDTQEPIERTRSSSFDLTSLLFPGATATQASKVGGTQSLEASRNKANSSADKLTSSNRSTAPTESKYDQNYGKEDTQDMKQRKRAHLPHLKTAFDESEDGDLESNIPIFLNFSPSAQVNPTTFPGAMGDIREEQFDNCDDLSESLDLKERQSPIQPKVSSAGLKQQDPFEGLLDALKDCYPKFRVENFQRVRSLAAVSNIRL